jgi:hypothetical protein
MVAGGGLLLVAGRHDDHGQGQGGLHHHPLHGRRGLSKCGFQYVDSTGATLTFHFVGTYCGWVAKTADNYGKAAVTVDGGEAATVDLYSKNTMWRHLVWQTKGLAFGDHIVKISCTGKKRRAAKGTCIDVDALQIAGTLQ